MHHHANHKTSPPKLRWLKLRVAEQLFIRPQCAIDCPAAKLSWTQGERERERDKAKRERDFVVAERNESKNDMHEDWLWLMVVAECHRGGSSSNKQPDERGEKHFRIPDNDHCLNLLGELLMSRHF